MPGPIRNAGSIPLNQQGSTLPDVSDAMLNWFQPMVFGLVSKDVVDFQVVEEAEEIQFQGVMQPFSDRDLALLPEGQRAWSHWWLHAQPQLQLRVDWTVQYQGKQYRVKTLKDYAMYGYRVYHLTTDWSGSGPAPKEVTP